MALTATAQSTLPLTWDETIVPALRKRLESESRILAKRMSTASMTSQDDIYPYSSNPDKVVRERIATPTYSSDHGRPTPRSANHNLHQGPNGKVAKTHRRTGTAGSTSSHGLPKRARTYSQSNTYDDTFQNGRGTGPINGLPTPESSRSTSPLYQQGRTADLKPTRIPVVARGRTPSGSSHGHSLHNGRGSDASRNTSHPSSPPVGAQPDLWAVEESSNHSHSTVSVSSKQRSTLLNETAPFEVNSIGPAVYKRGYSHEEPATVAALPQSSTDSEETPFEHWYRGDIYRNGGVGELRVGGKQEMLDIANYGHRYARSKPSSSRGPSAVTDDFPTRRKRADSVTGVGARESFYMDEERAKELANVLNEDPLTDMEGDIDLDTSSSCSDHSPHGVNGLSSSTPPALDGRRSTTPSIKHSLEQEQNALPTRIPGPVPRQSSEPPQTQMPTQLSNRGGSEPPPFPSSSSSTSVSGRASQSSPTHSQSETQKRRAKSPVASVSKKPKTKPSKSPSRSKTEDESNRRSVANYPEPPSGGNIVDAIPFWTQPVPAGGNWDEVVLPVVARKRGLDGHYEQADGATISKKRPESERIEPAPGTFRYDHSKYRPPRDDDIPMNEFGQRPRQPQDISIAEEEENQSRVSTFREDDSRPAYVRPLPQSSAPFSHYASQGKEGIPAITITRPKSDMERETKEEEGAGCCKCVIM